MNNRQQQNDEQRELTICIHVYVTILREGSPHDVETSV